MTMSSKKKAMVAVVGAAVVVFAGALAYALAPTEIRTIAPAAGADQAALVEQGRYVATPADCIACHTAVGGKAFAGGHAIQSPIGNMYSTNITPDKATGIGNYTLADFDRALRYGVANGHTLYPAMPYSAYARTTPDDVAALYAYFMQGVQPAAVAERPNEIPWPLSMRWPLTVWRWAFAPAPAPFRLAGADPVLRRGAYIVEGLGHCGDCHTPRGLGLQVRALGPEGGAAYLAGAMIDGWHAPSLRNGDRTTIGAWTEEQIAAFLRTGSNVHGSAFASMNEVIANSTQYLTPEDALAVARYLKSIRDTDGGQGRYAYDPATSRALRSGDAGARGAMLYLDNCAACHRPDGKGYEGVFPALAGNPAIAAGPPDSVIRVVLEGMQTARTTAAPAQFTMPGFAARLSDAEVADVATFVRSSWGNGAPAVAAQDVKRLRR